MFRIWILRVALVAACAFIGLTPAAAQAVHDLGPSFWTFWNAGKSKPPADQIRLWKDLYYEPNREVLGSLQCEGLTTDTALLRALERIPPRETAMRALSMATAEALPRARAEFKRTFPDLAWDGDIYVLFSAGCFDGKRAIVNGRSALLFGFDVIAQTGQDNLSALVQHELFHAYHRAFFPETSDDRLWNYLWEEGLAVYATNALNPSATPQDLLLGGGLIAGVDARRAAIASDLLKHFESRNEADYARYFLGGVGNGEFPSRAAYYAGSLVAARIARDGASLSEMVHWSAAEAKPHVRAALEAMARGE